MGDGNEFVVVANRLPVDRTTGDDGEQHWTRSPGGLVSALEPIVRSSGGAWVGWSGAPDDDAGPEEVDGIQLRPVPLSAEDVDRYYEGQSNSTIWPLFHDLVEPPVHRREWRQAYDTVNRRFAEATAEVAADGATVWVHDYQLLLVPAMLRALRPDLRIGFFLHIPFPPVELFMQLPRRAELLRGLLGADLVGFQRPLAAQNFLQLTSSLLGLEPAEDRVAYEGRTVVARAFPISIDVAEIDRLAADPAVQARAKQIRAELGDPETVILGVDRLDYTKGIELRLKAFRELLADGKLKVGDAVMVQVATPSRERVEHYQSLRVKVEREVGRINGEFGRVGVPAVHYLHQSYSKQELAALYVAADVMMVTPLRDGMNLVAKEYVACRADTGGALVLSEFAGAATEMRQSFLCNPHDPDGVKDALMRAVGAEPAELKRRMRVMQRHLRTHDVAQWAQTFLEALEVAAEGRAPEPAEAQST